MAFEPLPGDANIGGGFQPTGTEGVFLANGSAPDSRKNVRFYDKKVIDPVLSAQYGRPMTKLEPYVFIQEPGERDYIDDPLRNKAWAPQRFPRQWAAYKAQQEQAPEGTPIEFMFPQQPHYAENLRQLSIHTVEQMANLSDTGAQNIGIGAFQWRDKAKNYLEIANKGVGAHKLQTALDERDNKIAVMENQMAQMRTEMDRLRAQLEQGIPPTMVPSTKVHTQAQGHAGTVEMPPKSDWTAPASVAGHEASAAWTPAPQSGAGTDWTVDAADQGLGLASEGVSGPAIPNDPPQPLPRRRGRPPKSAAAA